MSAHVYYVVVVDANTIRLTSTKYDSLLALPVNLTSLGAGEQAFTGDLLGSGITILADFDADNGSSAGVELSDDKESWISVFEGALTGDLASIAAMARNGTQFANDFRTAFAKMLAPPVDDPND